MRKSLVLILLAVMGMTAPAQTNLPSVPLAPAPTPTPAPLPAAQPVPFAPQAPTAQPTASPAVPATATGTKAAKQSSARRRNNRSSRRATPTPAAAPARQAIPTPALPEINPAPQRTTQRAVPTPPAAPRLGANMMPPNFKIDGRNVKLERIRVLRSRNFARASEDLDDEESAQWISEMGLQIRVTPPRDWDVIEIAEAGIIQAQDQNNQPLPGIHVAGAPDPTSPAPNLNALEPLFKRLDGGAMSLLLRATPPPAATRGLKTLDCRIKVKLGYRQKFIIRDLRSQVGKPILHNSGLADLAMQVNEVTADSIGMIALGELSRIGTITFTDAEGRKVTPYNAEVSVKDADKKGTEQAKIWHYSFSKLPGKVDMELSLYPIVMPRNLTVKFTDVPLP